MTSKNYVLAIDNAPASLKFLMGILLVRFLPILLAFCICASACAQQAGPAATAPLADAPLLPAAGNNVSLSPDEQQWLSQHEWIRIGITVIPPQVFRNDGKYKGLSIDYIQLMERKLGCRFDLVPYATWNEVIEAAKTRQIDMIFAAQRTAERLTYLQFTQPYIELANMILVRKDRQGGSSLNDMQGWSVAVSEGSTVHEYLKKEFGYLELRPLADELSRLMKVSMGEADAMVVEVSRASEILDKGLSSMTDEEKREISQRWIIVGDRSIFASRTFWIIFFAGLGVITLTVVGAIVWNRTLRRIVRQLTAQLREDITERKQAEGALISQTSMLNSVTRVLREAIACESAEQLGRTCLAVAEELTGSKLGFIDELNAEGKADSIAISDPGWEACRMPKTDAVILLKNVEVRGIWASVIRQGRSLIVNDPATHPDRVGTPPGHPPITSFLGVPLKQAGRTIGLIGLANKEAGYTPADQEAVEALSGAFVEALMRKHAEDALRAASLYTRNLIETSLDPLVTISAEGKITDVNRATEYITGISRERLIGTDFSAYFTEPEVARAGYLKAFAQGKVIDYPLAVHHASGAITDVLYNAIVYRNELGEVLGVFAAARDITERKRAEEELRRHREHLEVMVAERTAELQAVNRELEAFSYSVSHDLRAPLRSVDAFAKMIEEDYAERLDDEGRRLLQVIRDSARDMGQLISDLLAFSRLSRKDLKMWRIGMSELIEDVRRQVEQVETGRAIRWNLGELPPAFGDEAMIREVLINLLANAVKFTRPRLEAAIGISGRVEGNNVVYSLTDNGVGFDMAYKDKLFCIFQRLHTTAEFEGTGIGLALVQRIVQRHGGRVWAEGKVNEGATFYFTLPCRKNEEEETP